LRISITLYRIINFTNHGLSARLESDIDTGASHERPEQTVVTRKV
jgi:hypothetical protein